MVFPKPTVQKETAITLLREIVTVFTCPPWLNWADEYHRSLPNSFSRSLFLPCVALDY